MDYLIEYQIDQFYYQNKTESKDIWFVILVSLLEYLIIKSSIIYEIWSYYYLDEFTLVNKFFTGK